MEKMLVIFAYILALLHVMYAEDMSYLLLSGKTSGHMGLYYQGMTGNAPSFVDANVSLSYQTQQAQGINVGGSFWATTKIFQANAGDFSQIKDSFVLTELYASFKNPNRITAYIGRFKTDSEWIKYYTQGVLVRYEDVENIKVDFIWANKNAYVTNYRVKDFYNPFGSIGSAYLGATITLRDSPLQIIPYIYTAPNDFNVFGGKVIVMIPMGIRVLYGKMHFLSFVNRNKEKGSISGGDGGLVWLEGGSKWNGLNAGLGIISVGQRGARGIDSFGQSSHFERREGLFFDNATTLYVFAEYDLSNIMQLDMAIRDTSIGSRHILNWEAGLVVQPQYNTKIGLKAIGMVNKTDFPLDDSIFAQDGRNYLLVRFFGQVNF